MRALDGDGVPMVFHSTDIDGAFEVELEPKGDDRGFFARMWCRDTFEQQGLVTDFVQANTAFSRQQGTLRGLHYQAAPHQEAKLVRCIQGAAFDVAVDVRPDSETFGAWAGVRLSQDNRRLFYVPEGCAHGYLTLTDDTELLYLVTAAYAPDAERGVRYDDPAFAIQWPADVQVLSEKDRSWPDVDLAKRKDADA